MSIPLLVCWCESGDAQGTIDLFPDGSLVMRDTARDGSEIEHDVISSSGKEVWKARGLITVQGNTVQIDYGGAYKNFNIKQGMYTGIMRLIFRDDEGYQVDVEWAEPDTPTRFTSVAAFVIPPAFADAARAALKATPVAAA